MAHDRYDWRTQFKRLRIINNLRNLRRIDIWRQFLAGNTELRRNQRSRIEVDFLIDCSHDPHHEEFLHDICCRVAHLGSQIFYCNALWYLDMLWTSNLNLWRLRLIATAVVASTTVVTVITEIATIVAVITAIRPTAIAVIVVPVVVIAGIIATVAVITSAVATVAAVAIVIVIAAIARAAAVITVIVVMRSARIAVAAIITSSYRAIFRTGCCIMMLAAIVATVIAVIAVIAVIIIVIAAMILAVMIDLLSCWLCLLFLHMGCRSRLCFDRRFATLEMLFQCIPLFIANTAEIIFYLEVLLLQDIQNIFAFLIEFFGQFINPVFGH